MFMYHAEVVIQGVGHLGDDEETALLDLVPGAEVAFEKEISQVHLGWGLESGTFGDAVDSARCTLHKVTNIIGDTRPGPAGFTVRKADHT